MSQLLHRADHPGSRRALLTATLLSLRRGIAAVSVGLMTLVAAAADPDADGLPAPAASAPTKGPEPCRLEPLSRPIPSFPAKAISSSQTGTVHFEFRILATGKVTDVRALENSEAAFVDRTLAAVRQWEFEPKACIPTEGLVARSYLRFSLSE